VTRSIRRRTFLGAAALAPAACLARPVAAVDEPPITIDSTGPSFPLINCMAFGGINYGDPTFSANVAKHDLAILGVYVGWGNSAAVVNNIKAINPNILLGNYTSLNELHVTGADADLIAKVTSERGPNGVGDWWAYDHTGAHVSSYPGNDTVNYTELTTPDANGYHWPEWLARRDSSASGAIGDGAAWDMWFCDNNFYRPRVTADWNRDGVDEAPGATSASTSDAWSRNGELAYYNTAKSLRPNMYIVANSDSDLSGVAYPPNYGPFPEYKNVLHGAMLEALIGETWSAESRGGFSWMMSWYHGVFTNLLAPKIVIFNLHHNVSTDYQTLRYALSACLMDNGYFQSNNSSGYTTQFMWYDEYDCAGTKSSKWLGKAIDPPQTAPWSNGVYMRRFTGGLALCNPKGNGSQIVTPPSGYTRFSGTQAPTINNGAAVTGTVTLADRDGLLLVKT
jgi:Hypothetical glycosyl hydrolase family 15